MQQQHSTDVGNSDYKVLQPQRSSQCQNWRYPRFVSDKHHVVQSTCSLGIAMCPYEVANVRSLVIIEWWKHRLWELLMYRCQTDMPSFEKTNYNTVFMSVVIFRSSRALSRIQYWRKSMRLLLGMSRALIGWLTDQVTWFSQSGGWKGRRSEKRRRHNTNPIWRS